MANGESVNTLISTFERIYNVTEDTAKRLLYSRDLDGEDTEAGLIMLEMFMLLCNNWKQKELNNKTKEKVINAQANIRQLYYDIFTRLHMMHESDRLSYLQARLAKTSNREKANQLRRMGLHNSYLEAKDMSASHDELFSTLIPYYTLLEIADKANPVEGLRLPRTTNSKKAKQLEKLGYKNAQL